MANTEVGSGYVSLWPKISGNLPGEGAKVGSQFMRGIEGGIKSSTVALGNIMGNVVQSTVGGFGELMQSAMSSMDTLKKFDQSMAFAGYDQATIDKSSAAMKKYADETVYDLNTIVKTTSILGGNGVKDFEQVTEALGNLTAVAGGSADDFDAASLAMTQIVGAGKLARGDWMQFVSNLSGSRQLLIDQMRDMGAYEGNFEEALTNGEISAEEFLAAIQALGMDQSAIDAARSTETFEGAVGNLQAAIENGLMQVIDSVGMENITGAINAVTGAVEQAAPVIADGIQRGFQWIMDHGEGVKRALMGIAGTYAGIKLVSAAVNGLKTAKSIAGGIKSLAGKLTAAGTAGAGAGAGLGTAAAGETAAGNAAKFSAKQVLAMAGAVIALGLGVLLAGVGLYIIAQGAIQIAQAGAPAGLVMLGMVVAIGLLAAVFAYLGPMLTAASFGMIAFGVALVLVGAGILLACAGVALLSGALPALSEYGSSAAGGLVALGGAAIVFGVGAIVAGAGCIILGAGLMVAGAGIAVVGAGAMVLAGAMMVMAVAVLMAGTGFVMLGSGLKIAASALPMIATSGPVAAAALAALAGAGAVAAGGMLALKGPLKSVADSSSESAGALTTILSAMVAAGAGATAASYGFSAFATGVQTNMNRARSAVTSAVSSMRSTIASAKFTLPRVEVGPLPHFRMVGDFNPKDKTVPVVNVSWYAKGGVFNAAKVIGVGEAGPEAVIPLKKRVLGAIGDGIADTLDPGTSGRVVNIYINGAKVNADNEIKGIVTDMLVGLKRKGAM